MDKDQIKTKIEILQRNKTIMACEAVAVNTSVMIGIFLVSQYVTNETVKDALIVSGGLFGIAYALYASFGNYRKHNMIKKLEKEL